MTDTKPKEPPTEADLAAMRENDAQTAALRALLRNMGGDAPAPTPAPPAVKAKPQAVFLTPQPAHDPLVIDLIDAENSRMQREYAARVAKSEAQGIQPRQITITEAERPEDVVQWRPAQIIAMRLKDRLESAWVNVPAPFRPERTNDDRAAEGAILCDLMAAMTYGSTEPVIQDLAPDTITQILHHMHRAGMTAAEISDATEMARMNFNAELDEEALAAINRVTARRAPAWAWQMIDQCLQLDADSKAADLETRLGVNNAMIALRVATADLTVNELLVDDLIDQPDFIESEVPDGDE